MSSERIDLPILPFCLVAIARATRAMEWEMKKILFASMAGVAAVVTIAPANAADLGLRPMYAAPPAFTWSGCYIGGNIGGGWGRDTVSIPNLGQTTGVPELAGVSLPSVTGNTKGVVGGGQVGCNYQVAPNWVIGIEGDGEAAGIKGDVTQSVSFTDPRTGGPNTVTGTAHAQTDWIASVTGRVGWTWDRVMLYARVGRRGPVINTQQIYRPLTNTSQPALRDRAGRLAAVSNGRFGKVGPQRSNMITTTSALAT